MMLANILVGLVVWAKGTGFMACFVVPLPILLIAFKFYLSWSFDKKLRYYATGSSGLKDPESSSLPPPPGPGGKAPSRRSDKLGLRFGHPALYKPLMVPMVHAKAQHVLASVYKGRLDSDSTLPSHSGYGDVPMYNMQPGGKNPGAAEKSAAPFELVPESQMDFAYYKNRGEFADDHGGGDIFGKNSDLISERPDTPQSFMTGSGGTSRVGSPGPGGAGYRRQADGGLEGTTYPIGYFSPNMTRDDSPGPGNRGVPHRSRTPGSSGGSSAGGFVDLGDPGVRNVYTHNNESETRLVAQAQGMGVGGQAPPAGIHPAFRGDNSRSRSREGEGYQAYRPPGAGAQTPGEEDPMSYEYFRRGRQ
jgi:calcium permeable stress-gated cation channel